MFAQMEQNCNPHKRADFQGKNEHAEHEYDQIDDEVVEVHESVDHQVDERLLCF